MAENEKTAAQRLKEALTYKTRDAYDVFDDAAKAEMAAFSKEYCAFLDKAKTEREAVKQGVALAAAAGFVPYRLGDKVEVGGKYYVNNRGKSLYLFVVGSDPIDTGIRIAAAHIDSPRLDLKPNPLYEDSGMAFFKTHYYGGIKKYQWTTVPLALHGVVSRADGETVDVCIGEDDEDPVFYIDDLLPHLGGAQMSRSARDVIPGESLNILLGTTQYPGEGADEKFKLNILSILNDKYGITEGDFLSAELTMVPALKSRDVGLDRSLIGGYGHDDRVCAYPALAAILHADKPSRTLMTVLADKEETGSMGNTGMQSDTLTDLIESIANALGKPGYVVRAASQCLSADVNAAFDPNFSDVYERRNAAFLNHGVVLTKYTGGGGKSSTNDASAEFCGQMRRLFDSKNIVWQTGELGKVDAGGGGTVACYIANHNIEVVDLGVPVISMHAPWEVISKADLYSTYRAFSAFLS